MISRDMCRLLKRIPRWPENKPFDKITKIPFMRKYRPLHLLIEAKKRNYVGCNGSEEHNDEGFYLTEKGKEAIDEYRQQQRSNRISWIALAVSLGSLVVSVISLAK